MQKLSNTVSAIAFGAIVLLITSCVTSAPIANPKSPSDFFAYFLPSADSKPDANDIYAVIPVSDNEELVHMVSEKFMPQSSIDDVINRTETLYMALNFAEENFKLSAVGNFPKSLSGFIFSKSNGWTKLSFAPQRGLLSSYAEFYQSRFGFQASIPNSHLVFVSCFGMESMLENLQPIVPVKFDMSEKARDILEDNTADRIRFYVANPKPLIARLLGDLISLPVSYAAGSFSPMPVQNSDRSEYNTIYEMDVYLKISETRFLRAAVNILNGLLKNFSTITVTMGVDSDIFINGIMVGLETIEEML